MEVWARWKQSWSKPVNEDDVTIHLSTFEGDVFCGIHKRHIDIYHIGHAPVENIEQTKIYICKNCYKIYLNYIK